jgi:hypothetical protein
MGGVGAFAVAIMCPPMTELQTLTPQTSQPSCDTQRYNTCARNSGNTFPTLPSR